MKGDPLTAKQYHYGNLRPKLLRTAAKLISQEGVEKVTMRSLSQKIGVSRTAAYRHFKNKTDLLCAIAEEGFTKLTRRLKKINKPTSEDSFARFQQIGGHYIEFALEFPGYYRLMFGHEIIAQKRTNTLHQAAQATFSELLKSIEVCQKENKLNQDDPLLLANTVWAWAHGLSMLLIDRQIDITEKMHVLPALLTPDSTPDRDGIEKMIQLSMDVLTHGIRR